MSFRRGTVLLCALAGALAHPAGAFAQPTVEIKPEFMMIIDTSGSMTTGTGAGNNSCGYTRTRINDAKCVFRQIVDSTGDGIFGLERFASQTCSFSTRRGCQWASGGTCNTTASSGQVLVGISEGDSLQLVPWVDNSCDTCSLTSGNPELGAAGNTPLEGSLRAAQAYYQGPTSPMINDPFAACRPHYVILLTDGDETCGGTPANAATSLHSTVVPGVGTFDVKTFVIGFGQTPCYGPLEGIAQAGGTDAPGSCSAFYATDEQSLSLAMSQIISSSLLVEKCNGQDDNCNGLIDEGFNVGATCSVGVGACQRTGVFACTADGSGTECIDPQTGNPLTQGPPGTETCPPNGIDDDCDGVVDDIPGGCPACTPEVCNGRDDDCDGTVDELNQVFPCPTTGPNPPGCQCPAGRSCGNVGDLPFCWCPPGCGSSVGQCRPGVLQCVGGVESCAGGQGPRPEVCNGLDDNCNGVIDDVPPVACYDGMTGCTAGGPGGFTCQGVCRAGTRTCGACNGEVTPVPEIACNGLDDNCNGVVDEPQGQRCYPTGTSGCVADGTGGFACTGACRTGTFQCQGGQLTCVGAVTPSAEICDGLDNDCNGAVDDFLCGQAQGICTARCEQVGGVWQCNTRVGARSETCNGQDDDCNGVVDDNIPGFGGACAPTGATCNLAAGTCCGICAPGTLRCIGGAPVCDGATSPRAETCNGLDDDCDCAVDDNIPGFGGPCGSGVGACRPGTFQCVAGVPQCAGGRGPGPETCNGVDDDCDGIVDDNIPGVGGACFTTGPASDCNLLASPPVCNGICRPGQTVCQSGALSCQGQIGPRAETCNGQDDDCDGIIDNGFNVGGPCTVMFGTCTSTGQLICRPDGTGTTCNAPPISSSPEVCDGVDNNCDGAADEPSQIWPCPSTTNPPGCICPAGLSCGNLADLPSCSCPPQCGLAVGECQPGHLECISGGEQCVGGTSPQPEICDCLDNNCNGVVDDNPVGEGDTCFTYRDPNGNPLSTTPPSTCRPGHKHCQNMGTSCGFACEGQIGPSPEICDGLDNDCDGIVDNGATCPPNYMCINGSCVADCQPREFPCSPQYRCIDPSTGNDCPGLAGCVCLPDACLTAGCDSASQDCVIEGGQPMCRDRCPAGHCPDGYQCNPQNGSCFDCHSAGCPQGQVCVGSPGVCQVDPCATANCPLGTYCRDGQCIGTCPGGCPDGQVCQDGQCQASRCAGVDCAPGSVCNPDTGQCQGDQCNLGCRVGEACVPRTGQCEPDPCATTRCEVCASCSVDFDGHSQCTAETGCVPGITVTSAGGGGCACSVAAREEASRPVPLLPLMLLLGLVLSLRRRGRR